MTAEPPKCRNCGADLPKRLHECEAKCKALRIRSQVEF